MVISITQLIVESFTLQRNLLSCRPGHKISRLLLSSNRFRAANFGTDVIILADHVTPTSTQLAFSLGSQSPFGPESGTNNHALASPIGAICKRKWCGVCSILLQNKGSKRCLRNVLRTLRSQIFPSFKTFVATGLKVVECLACA